MMACIIQKQHRKQGHGIKVCLYAGVWFSGSKNQDGIITIQNSGEGEVLSSGNNISVKYELIDMNRLMGFAGFWLEQGL